ncbi:MAG: PKD domain-containing protein [Parafilimonas sp.]
MFSFISVYANHVVGGEIFYSYIGPGGQPNTSKYAVSLRLFRDCDQPCGGTTGTACLPLSVTISIFVNNPPYARVNDYPVNRTNFQTITLTTYPPCISAKPYVCYEIATYTQNIDLADNAYGYRIAFQTCCRAPSANVLSDAQTLSGVPGATYECVVPGTNQLSTGHNSSAIFNIKDTALVCKQSPFVLDFSATDADGDSLSYQFQSAYGGGAFTSATDLQAGFPLYKTVNYNTALGYSGTQPLGANVTIDPASGIISGNSPDPNLYVVCVSVAEWRNGIIISVHRKDFIMVVNDCSIPAPTLKPSYITCDGYNLTFSNSTNSSLIKTYYWDFGVTSLADDTSNVPVATYTYPDSGTYTVTLIVNRGMQCTDTVTTQALVYPGFIPDFKYTGSCVTNPYNFFDLTTSKYGFVDSWHWDFGDLSTLVDTAIIPNTSYLYPSSGARDVSLIVTNSKGCLDTVIKQVSIVDNPVVTLPFTDTLICSIDTLQLQSAASTSAATFNWQPGYNIINPTSATPFVYPKTTTTYNVTIDDSGCVASASVTVNVIDKVLLDIGADTTICQTDSIQLSPNTNALYFTWSPATGLNNPKIKDPVAVPPSNITYSLLASVGKCTATDAVNIKTVPYPISLAGPDTLICYGKTIMLSGNITGAFYTWSPVNSLLNSNSLTPVAGPQSTTAYVLSVTDTLGCPKPKTDTVVVNVITQVQAFAGNDTTIVATQPLQLNAGGGDIYSWSPASGMNNTKISNPLVILGASYDSVTYRLKVETKEGCVGYDDITVRVFKTKPDIFVPTGFTPNGDGLNDVLKPTAVGLKQFLYFRVYNRWGQMVYSTGEQNKGWDGTFAGTKQASGTYVFVAEGVDYLGNRLLRKGTAVLIR